jgi:hypothetical protein
MNAPDRLTADLRLHETMQDLLQARHDAYSEQALTSIVDDLLSNKKVGRMTLQDFCDFVTEEHIAMFIFGNVDARADMVTRLEKRVEQSIRNYFENSTELDERVRELDNAARESQMERSLA